MECLVQALKGRDTAGPFIAKLMSRPFRAVPIFAWKPRVLPWAGLFGPFRAAEFFALTFAQGSVPGVLEGTPFD